MNAKKSKRPHTEIDSDSDNEDTNFPRFIVLEATSNIPLTKMSPFIIQKVISSKITPKNVKKLRNGTILVEVQNKKQAKTLLQLQKLHETNIKAYPHQTLNYSKGVIKNQEISVCTTEEIKTELKNQGVTDVKRITFKKKGEVIYTNTYILTFNYPQIPETINIGYERTKIEQYIPKPLQCYNCQKFGHNKDQCLRFFTCGNCSEKNPDHDEEDCPNKTKCTNCQEEHHSHSKQCKIYKQEKEIITIKYQKNITFQEARKEVTNRTKNSYATITQQANKMYNYNELNLAPEIANLAKELKNILEELKSFLSELKINSNSQIKVRNEQPSIKENETKEIRKTSINIEESISKEMKPPQLSKRERSKSLTRTKTDVKNKHTTTEKMEIEQNNKKTTPQKQNDKQKTELVLIENENKFELVETGSQKRQSRQSKSKSPRPKPKKSLSPETRNRPSTSKRNTQTNIETMDVDINTNSPKPKENINHD